MLGRLCHPFKAIFSSFRKNKRGNVAITFTIAIIPIMMAFGGGADYVLVQNVKTKTRAAADAAILAAISPAVIDQNKTKAEILTLVDAEIRSFFDFHITRFKLTQNVTVKNYTPAAYTQDDRIRIRLCYEGIVKTNFSGFANYESFSYSDCVEATSGSILKYYDIYFIVDASTSMGFGATKQDQINIKNNAELKKLFFDASIKFQGSPRPMYRSLIGNHLLREDCAHICHINDIPKVAKKYSNIKTRLDVAKSNIINFINSLDESYFLNSKIRMHVVRFSSAGYHYAPGEDNSYIQEPQITTFRITSRNSNKEDIIKKVNNMDFDTKIYENTNKDYNNTHVKGGGATNFYSSFNYIIDSGFFAYMPTAIREDGYDYKFAYNPAFHMSGTPANSTGEKGSPFQLIVLVTDGLEDTKNAVSMDFAGREKYGNAINSEDTYRNGVTRDGKKMPIYFTWWVLGRKNEKDLPISLDSKVDGSSGTLYAQPMISAICEEIRSFGDFYILRMPFVFEDHRSLISKKLKEAVLGNVEDSATADTPLTRGVKACANAPLGEDRVIYGDNEDRLVEWGKKIFPERLKARFIE